MKIINSNNIIIQERNIKGNYYKYAFELDNIETYIESKKFLVDIKDSKSNSILLILTDENIGYKVFIGHNEYLSRLNLSIDILKKNALLFKEKNNKTSKGYYILLESKKILEFEDILYELCLFFRFSSFLGLKQETDINDITKEINKFRLLGLYSFKRWKNLIKWQFFFDGEHFSGDLISAAGS